MPTPTQKARVGAFVVLGIFLLLFSLVVTVGLTNEKTSAYTLVFDESVDGLSIGSVVKYRGLPIGRVTEMRVGDQGRLIRVEIEVADRVATLYNGVTARIASSGVVGATFVQIEGGDPANGVLSDRAGGGASEIKTLPSLTSQIQTNLPEIILDLRDIMSDLNESVHAMDLQDIVGETRLAIGETRDTIASARRAIDSLDGRVAVSLEKIDAAADSVTSAAGVVGDAAVTVDGLAGDLNAPLKTTVEDAGKAIRNVDKALDDLQIARLRADLNETVSRLNALLSSADGAARNVDAKVDDVADDLDRAIFQVQRLLEALERDPSSLVFGPQGADGGSRE